jgi:hypothetical protein
LIAIRLILSEAFLIILSKKAKAKQDEHAGWSDQVHDEDGGGYGNGGREKKTQKGLATGRNEGFRVKQEGV